MLKVENLRFSYGKQADPVLRGATLELEQGQIGILLGKNGSGKTSLFKNILGIEKPSGGQIRFDGENLLKMPRRERARRIAYVPQHIHFGDLSVFDSVLMGRVSYFGMKAGLEDYEIVEKIQDEVLHMHTELRNSLAQASPDQYPALVERFSLRYKEISQLLMKVQTERVNLPLALVKETEQHYMATSDSPTKELEAKVYAAACTSMMVALLDDKQEYPLEKTFDVILAVALRMLGLPDDPELRQKIMQRRKQMQR